jgi:hypothetical protein
MPYEPQARVRIALFLAATGLVVSATRPHVAAHGPAPAPTRVPFRVGERLTYAAHVSFLSAGSATMSIEDAEEIRGHSTYHSVFDVRGHVLWFHVNDHSESWFDPATMISYHQIQHVDESRYNADRVYDFYPDRRVYVRNGEEGQSVSDPIDEDTFIYFLRTIPLEVGKTYTFNRYYHLDRNPIRVSVERRERVKVPAGEFDALVLKPTINSKGLFSDPRDTEIWISDDSARTVVRLKSKLPVGTLSLDLKQAEYASVSSKSPEP